MPIINPVKAADGRLYEKADMVKWLEKSKNSPMTNLPLFHSNLRDMPAQKRMIASLMAKLSPAAVEQLDQLV